MAFFLKSRQQETLPHAQDSLPDGEVPEAPRLILAIPLLVLSDGDPLCAEDVDLLARLLSISPIYRGYSPDELREFILDCDQAESDLSVAQICTRVSAVLSLPLRETALSLAMQVVLSDGHYDESEHDTLYEVAKALGIQSDRFLHMFEVLVILHRTLD